MRNRRSINRIELLVARLLPVALPLLVSCLEEPSGITIESPPAFSGSAVNPNPHNVLSLIVSAQVMHADSVAVRFRATDANDGEVGVTPGVAPHADSVRIPVLGLHPDRDYEVHAVAWGPGGATSGPPLQARTGSLPSDLPAYSAGGSDPTPGYIAFAAGRYGLVTDNTGRIVWYRQFPNGAGLNFMAQPTGHYAVRPPTPDANDIEPWLELDALGNVTRTITCGRGLQARFHDLISEPDRSTWLMCDETRTMDLSAVGGQPAARVTATVVQHIGRDGSLLFEWNPFDHFAITDLPAEERAGAAVNWTHGNSLDFDDDGRFLISFRSLGEITKIDPRTGSVVWRMGGRANQFTFLDTPLPAFSRQHSVRAPGHGQILLLDNIGDPLQSKAERYVIDEGARTVRLVRSLGAGQGYVTSIGGSVQDLPGGRTLAAYGTAGRVEEYDAGGRVVWSIHGNAGYVFRAHRIASLYSPGVIPQR